MINEALADYTETIKLIDHNPYFYCSHGLSHQALGKLKEAIDDFQKAIDVGGFSDPESLRAKIAELKLELTPVFLSSSARLLFGGLPPLFLM